MTFFSNHSPNFGLLCQSSMWRRGVPWTVLATIFFRGQATNMVTVLSPTTNPLSPKFQFSSFCMVTTAAMQQMAATVTTPMATTAASQQPLSSSSLFFIFVPLASSRLFLSSYFLFVLAVDTANCLTVSSIFILSDSPVHRHCTLQHIHTCLVTTTYDVKNLLISM